MATVNLYQEIRPKFGNKVGEYPIYIRLYHSGNKKDKSLKVFVPPKNWVEKDQRIQGKNLKSLNDKVQRIKSELIALILDLERNEVEPIPSIVLAEYYAQKADRNAVYVVNRTASGWKMSLNNWFAFVEQNRKSGTTDNSRQFKVKFESFVKKKHIVINELIDINYKVSDRFREYLYDEGLSFNTVGKLIARLRAWIRHENKISNTPISNTQNFNSKQLPKSYIALTIEELDKLKDFPFKSSRLAKARDVFIAITFTGLRISDYSKLDAGLIEDDIINIRLKKTETSSAIDASIPLLKEVKEMLNRNNGLFPQLSETKLREYLKEACKEAKFKQLIEVTFQKKDNQSVKHLVPKYKLITPHTGIKTMANYLQEKGLDTDFISTFLNKSPKTLKKHYLRERNTVEMKKKLEDHGLT
jgi:hypothetical protein